MYRIILMTIAMLTTVLSVFANAATPDHGRTLIVQLKGRAIGETRTIPPIDPTRTTSEGNCFDADITDAVTSNSIGTATRCFTDVSPGNGGTVLTGPKPIPGGHYCVIRDPDGAVMALIQN